MATQQQTISLPHYLSVTTLQLTTILFTLTQSHITSSSHHSITTILNHLITSPIISLTRICLGISIGQIYVGIWARQSRRKKVIPSSDHTKTIVNERRGFMGALKEMKLQLLSGKAPIPSDKMKRIVIPDLNFLPIAAGVTLLAAAVFHAFAILLGAPLTSHIPETFLLCLLLSLLTITPLAIAIPIKTEPQAYLRLFSKISPQTPLEQVLLYPALGALLGSYSGAFPIPLDWDQSWQSWPTTFVLGGLVGHALGSFIAVGVCLFEAVRLSPLLLPLNEIEIEEKEKEEDSEGEGKKKNKKKKQQQDKKRIG